jgi:ParB family chromosome partitioning protein
VYQRLKLADLEKPASEAFLKDEITAGHAILIARLQPKDQAEALKRCFDIDGYGYMRRWNGEGPRTACSVRELGHWIQENIHLDLHSVPFNKTDPELVPAAGTCTACPKRTGFLPALFPDIAKKDTCTDRTCFNLKLEAHIAKKKLELEASGKVLQISTDYSHRSDTKDKSLLTSNSYERIEGKKDHCDSAEKAIVVEGHRDRGRVVDICRDPKCKQHGRERFSSGSSSNDRYAADQKRKEEKARNETTLRRRILDGILAVGRKEPSTEDLRLIATRLWHRTEHDTQKIVATRWSWEPERKTGASGGWTDWSKIGKKAIAGADPSELVSMLLELSLIADTLARVYGVTDNKQLLETAKRYKVDVKSIEKKFAAELAEKKAKKAAREKKAKATSEAKLKKVVGDLHGCTPKGKREYSPMPGVTENVGIELHPCEVCNCDEFHACAGGCMWDPKFLKYDRYVCNNCSTKAAPITTKPKSRKSQTSAEASA